LADQEIIAMFRTRGGLVEPYGDSNRVPLQERFFLGGPNAFRGSGFRKLSPRDPVTGDRIGGNQFGLFTTEVGFPVFKEIVDLRGAIFFDAAQVVAQDDTFDFDPEYAFGVGLGLVTPFGPVRIDLGYNPDPRADDETFLIHFNIGRVF
jgi:outer membrane protein insertion porin family